MKANCCLWDSDPERSMQYLAIRESPESEKSGKSTPYGLTGDLIGKETCPTIIALTHVAFCFVSVVPYCEPHISLRTRDRIRIYHGSHFTLDGRVFYFTLVSD